MEQRVVDNLIPAIVTWIAEHDSYATDARSPYQKLKLMIKWNPKNALPRARTGALEDYHST
jgi:hypothetical protein